MKQVTIKSGHAAVTQAERASRETDCVDIHARAQAFFAAYAVELRKPHISDRDKDILRNMLLRATEAGLYKETP